MALESLIARETLVKLAHGRGRQGPNVLLNGIDISSWVVGISTSDGEDEHPTITLTLSNALHVDVANQLKGNQ